MTSGWRTLSGEPPAVIAHRGASGLRPEHTIEAYTLAIDQGADWIEPDLVVTKDGVLVARHERHLSHTTDVADHAVFADRRVTKSSNGQDLTDWWVEDFTLAELKTLRARQAREDRSKAYDGQFAIPTFAEVVALAQARSTPDRTIGVIPETKEPGALSALGFDIAGLLIAELKAAGWMDESAPVIVQSFEPEVLKVLKDRHPVRRVQLVFAISDGKEGVKSNIPLDHIPSYAAAVGPQKTLTVTPAGASTDFVSRAHGLGLAVYPWTYRDDAPPEDGAGIEAELSQAYALGVDGVFTDFPATAVAVRRSLAPTAAGQTE